MGKIVNYTEIWVKEYMEILLDKMDGCKCDICKRDIFALAINNLKSYYVTTSMGEIMAKLESTKLQFEADIVVEVTKAIKKVHENPNHKI